MTYTYDNMGNIATYTDANGTVTYTYDAQGQLLSATDGTTTYSYTYDTVGNILEANGHSYTYDDLDWKDLLTKVDGQEIVYEIVELDTDGDNVIDYVGTTGNPTSYYNGTRWTFGWEQGRRLVTATDGTTSLSFTYDADGLRTSKTVDGVKHTYLYASGKLLRETYGNNTLDFFYDTNGHPYALSHEVGDAEPVVYYYITNLQGDVTSIVDGTGTPVASYEYDPYGNIVTASGTLAEINPIRYRGYYYDSESGLYYLQSRYYDPELGRFINADGYVSTGQGILGNNMFAYCLNNPVCLCDSNGAFARNTYDLQQTGVGNTGNEASNPKNIPPNHPDFKSPKNGNKKARNPNGHGWGWLDAKGNVWVWEPKMHGGEGWVIQEPGGGHKHAYPGGNTRTHRMDVTPPQSSNTSFPAMPQETLITTYPAIQQGSMIIPFPAYEQTANITSFPQMNSGLVIMTVVGGSVYAFLASYLGGIEWS